jgi:8-oxo-dGTP pyrophosphatase MutT (NUDIX family)
MPAQDPAELFDLCDADGRPLGVSKPRALVHRDGDWHRSLHLWVILKDPSGRSGPSASAPELLLQRRSLAKDTQPGAVDIAVAGHLGAGETVLDALREAEEEIGLVVRPEDITRLGVRRRVFARPGVTDREIQEVFFTIAERPLASLRAHPEEVDALLAVPLPAAVALCSGEIARALVRELRPGDTVSRSAVLDAPMLLQDRDGYFALALGSIVRRLDGLSAPVLSLGFEDPEESNPRGNLQGP